MDNSRWDLLVKIMNLNIRSTGYINNPKLSSFLLILPTGNQTQTYAERRERYTK